MHTFSLKLSQNQSSESNTSRIKNARAISHLEGRRNSNGSTKKAFYVEQNTKVLETVIKRSEPVLTEFLNRIKRFESYTELNESERVKLIQTLADSSFSSIEQEYS